MDELPDISLGTAALVIFSLCAAYMLVRGLLRTFVNTAILVASIWAGFQTWQIAPALAISWFGKPSQPFCTAAPIIATIAAFLLLKKIIRFFLNPIPPSSEDSAARSLPQLVFRLFATLIPAAFLCLTIVVLIHHFGSISEIKSLANSDPDSSTIPSYAERLKKSLTSSIPQSLIAKLDPLTSQPRLELAKIIASHSRKPLEPVIDPLTGQPIPRAIIVDEPELNDLANDGRYGTLLHHPLLSEALKDPAIRRSLGID
jgi:hypothetical protein